MNDSFPKIDTVKFEGDKTLNPLAFRHYNPDGEVLEKSMKEHLRFSLDFGKTFCHDGRDSFGPGTFIRPWNTAGDPLENCRNRLRAAFEFMKKLGIGYYCFYDRDIAPEGASLSESNRNLDKILAHLKELQDETGIRPLWGAADLVRNPRYMCGSYTNPNAHVFAYAAAQVKKAMEITYELGGENFLFWGGREGYQCILNTDFERELEHMANFMKMTADYKKELGFAGTLLIGPKPRIPLKHLYNFDAAAAWGFLTHYGLNSEFKLNIECNHACLAGHDPEHEMDFASRYGILGSISANSGDPVLGWDTDQFTYSHRSAALTMWAILNQGGLRTGGLNLGARLRRESTDLEDMFIPHIASMDIYAKGLKTAARINNDQLFLDMKNQRYASYDTGIGIKIESATTNFNDLYQWVLKKGEPENCSGKQEKLESFLNYYLDN